MQSGKYSEIGKGEGTMGNHVREALAGGRGLGSFTEEITPEFSLRERGGFSYQCGYIR